jgi:hypothetical protein
MKSIIAERWFFFIESASVSSHFEDAFHFCPMFAVMEWSAANRTVPEYSEMINPATAISQHQQRGVEVGADS